MKVTLILVNIGQRIGKEVLSFNSGVVTLIKGRSASGKSRIIKSYALALSYPIKSDDLIKEAINFGILKDDNAEFMPLVNTNKDKATIELQYGSNSKKLELIRDGNIKTENPGDQNFLYSSVLVRNSKIQEYIVHGNSDFSWIVSEMSLAKDYEAVLMVITSYIENFNLKKAEIETKKGENIDIVKQLNESVDEKKKLDKNIKELEKEISGIQIDPKIAEKRKELMDIIAQLDELTKSYVRDEKILIKDNNSIEINIKKNKKINEGNRLKNLELTKKQKILEKIDIKVIQKEIIHLQEMSVPYIEILGVLKRDKKLWNELKIKEESECPLCHVGKVNPETVLNKRKEIEEEIKKNEAKKKEYDEKINAKQRRIKEKDKLPAIKKEIRDLEDNTFNLLGSTENYEEKLKSNNDKLESFKDKLITDKKELDEIKEELKPIEKEIKKNKKAQDLFKKKSQLDKQLGGIEKEISNLEKQLDSSGKIILYDREISIAEANGIIEDLDKVLNELQDHLKLKIEEQQGGAARNFNENINKLIKELKFSEFKEVSLDLNDYNLKVVRKDDTIQSISSLSGSERGIIAALLQICTKETYLPEIPFIVGDDIIMDMDPNRSEVFLNYLKKLAKKNDWVIVFTRVTEEDLNMIEL